LNTTSPGAVLQVGLMSMMIFCFFINVCACGLAIVQDVQSLYDGYLLINVTNKDNNNFLLMLPATRLNTTRRTNKY